LIYLSIALLVLDQITKELVRHKLYLGDQYTLCAFFNISHVHNTGAAWGMLSGTGDLLVWVSIAALILLIACRRTLMEEGPIQRWAMASIIGGILGNLVDRIRLGFVVDFLDFHWAEHHFPSFNVADSAITTGVALYLLGSWLSVFNGRKSSPTNIATAVTSDTAPVAAIRTEQPGNTPES
jgi:signal peptidase II